MRYAVFLAVRVRFSANVAIAALDYYVLRILRRSIRLERFLHRLMRNRPVFAVRIASVVSAAALLFLFAYGLYAEVMRENAFLSRTVELQEGQRVIDTGLYALVRHPMYTAVLLLSAAIPLVLGSGAAILPFLSMGVVLIFRIRGEERLLEAGLPGYAAYKKRVKYRLIPWIW